MVLDACFFWGVVQGSTAGKLVADMGQGASSRMQQRESVGEAGGAQSPAMAGRRQAVASQERGPHNVHHLHQVVHKGKAGGREHAAVKLHSQGGQGCAL